MFQVIRNVTSSKPTFYVKNLKPGTRFEARVYTSNQKGRSDEVFVMRASTLKRASDKRPVTSLASGAGKFSHYRVIDFAIVIIPIKSTQNDSWHYLYMNASALQTNDNDIAKIISQMYK